MVEGLNGQEKSFHRKNIRISNNHIEGLTLLLIRDIATISYNYSLIYRLKGYILVFSKVT